MLCYVNEVAPLQHTATWGRINRTIGVLRKRQGEITVVASWPRPSASAGVRAPTVANWMPIPVVNWTGFFDANPDQATASGY